MLLNLPAALASHSTVRHVSIIGRRSPLQAAFDTKELRELTALDSTSMLPWTPLHRSSSAYPCLTQGSPVSNSAPCSSCSSCRGSSTATPPAASRTPDPGSSHTKSWSLDFFCSPTALVTNVSDCHHQLTLTLAHSALNTSTRTIPTSVTSVQHTGLVVAAVGHHAYPAVVYVDPALGHLLTGPGGRVLNGVGRMLQHIYVSGWAANPAMGVRSVLSPTMLDMYADSTGLRVG